jgi:hypothetical protein
MSNGTHNNAPQQKVPLKLGELISLLEHPRALFIYHAGQRFSTINYFFVAFAVFAAAFVGTYTDKFPSLPAVRVGLAVMALFVTVIFWMLDRRNQELVHVDERGQHAIEELIVQRHPELGPIQLAKGWAEHKHPGWFAVGLDKNHEKHCWQRISQYKYIMPAMYLLFVIVSLLAIWQAWVFKGPPPT